MNKFIDFLKSIDWDFILYIFFLLLVPFFTLWAEFDIYSMLATVCVYAALFTFVLKTRAETTKTTKQRLIYLKLLILQHDIIFDQKKLISDLEESIRAYKLINDNKKRAKKNDTIKKQANKRG